MPDDYDFPDDLRAAQLALHQAQAEQLTFAATLPLSAEPMEAMEDPAHWYRRNHPRPTSPGYTPEQAAELTRIRALVLELATSVMTHPYWAGLSGSDVVTARMALKHAHEQDSAAA
ncbi:hypothetical protein [Streptomyces beijiangensis]|uniref:Uncharacterized protein n=1 Tax=Streptomyces beijiangensis TaxID=163361 RepID=A0A939F4J9_9ACTN|nr:hypothetical protein [Streptomyces beijiangensis]MBO0512421.1 hypothetical protein [Streptomyces beijiangensis]